MGRALRISLVVFLGGAAAGAFPLEFTVRGGSRITRDRFAGEQVLSGGGQTMIGTIVSENIGGYCLEAECAVTALGRWTPFLATGWSFDRSVLRDVSASQYLRSRGVLLLAGVSRSFGAVFTDVALSAGAGFEWETVESQTPYFGVTRFSSGAVFSSDAPVAAAGVSLDAPLFGPVWTTASYRYLHKLAVARTVDGYCAEYEFTPRRHRHYLMVGLSFRP
ncbi:MAG: hypothetical protein MUF78_03280 [Candidatus Edwardsbacteria bacterium]|nr:hypothetical protein [Candidatus Edwardsbacteria bacterium]